MASTTARAETVPTDNTAPATESISLKETKFTVTAVPDAHYHFVDWSDGVATATRTDTGVTASNRFTTLKNSG